MSDDRRQGRIAAMQALCQWELQSARTEEELDEFLADVETFGIPAEFARQILFAYWKNAKGIDNTIQATLEKWSMDRLSPVERNILRVGATEMELAAAPRAAIINEAVEIAREYGGAESPRFVNGVLDAMNKKTQGEP